MQKIKVIEQNKKRVKVTLNPVTINTLMKGFPGICAAQHTRTTHVHTHAHCNASFYFGNLLFSLLLLCKYFNQ